VWPEATDEPPLRSLVDLDLPQRAYVPLGSLRRAAT
jgi:hypothetical protein